MEGPRRHEPVARPGRGGERSPSADALWDAFAVAATPDAFYRSWLALQCRMIPDVGAGTVVAGPPDVGPFTPQAFWPERPRGIPALADVAERALAERRGIAIRRELPAEDDLPARERYHVAYPIQDQGRIYGVVALDLSPRSEAELEGVLRQLQWGSAWLELLVGRREMDETALARERIRAVLDVAAAALAREGFFAAASSFVTTLNARLGCERVSVGFVQRGHVRVRAVSHSAQFSPYTNLVRAIGAAMDEALDQGATVVHPPPPAAPARVTLAHEALVQAHGNGGVCTVPLASGGRHVGALTLERPTGRPFDAPALELAEAVAALAGPLLDLARRDDRWVGVKLAEAGWRQLTHLVGPRHVAMKLGVAATIALVSFLALATGDYRVSARTVMEAGVKRAAVAPFNGYLREAPVRAGDVVRKGQVLGVLDDRDLRLERARWTSQQDQYAKQRDQALANRNAAQVSIAITQIEQARAQIALLDEQIGRTRVLAAFDGVVVTGDLSQSLGSPVERGQVLFEVAPLDAYRVVLQVDERDVTDVAVGQTGRILLSASPSDAIPFAVATITPVSTAREGRNYFRVEARLHRVPERLRPGMEGVGKIDVDRRRLIAIWLRPVIDWLRLQLWLWLP
jgi:multidrug resistance efflux pump